MRPLEHAVLERLGPEIAQILFERIHLIADVLVDRLPVGCFPDWIGRVAVGPDEPCFE